MRLTVAKVFLALATAFCFADYASSQEGRVPSQSQVEDLKDLQAGEPGPQRELIYAALELIKDFEGWSATAYDDPAGYCTIGYGHLIALTKCANVPDLGEFSSPISKQRGLEILEQDTRSARRAVSRLVTVTTNSRQFGALASFTFNVGKGNFETSTLLKRVNEGDFNAAARQFRRWIFANGEALPGLVVRRRCSETLFRGDLNLSEGEAFSRGACQSYAAAPSGEPPIDITKGEQ